MNWDDLRFVLAIARTGTLAGAARRLRVDQTTVSRRLSSLESDLGSALFVRSRHGFIATESGEAVLEEIELMETAAMRVSERVGAEKEQPAGLVRIATMPWILNHILAPSVPQLSQRYPGIEVHGIADLRERSLSRREAELSLRFQLPARGKEREIPIGTFTYSVYAPRDSQADDLPWAGSAIDFGNFAPDQWLAKQIAREPDAVCFRSDDAGIISSAVRSGAAKGLLPDALAGPDPKLRRISGPTPALKRQLRILVHPDVEKLARVQVVVEWIKNAIAVSIG